MSAWCGENDGDSGDGNDNDNDDGTEMMLMLFVLLLMMLMSDDHDDDFDLWFCTIFHSRYCEPTNSQQSAGSYHRCENIHIVTQ